MSQMPIYNLSSNEFGAHPEGSFIVNMMNAGAQLQKVEWTNDQWVFAQAPYDTPVDISLSDAQFIESNIPIATHQGAPPISHMVPVAENPMCAL